MSIHEHNDTSWLLREKYGGNETPAYFRDCARLAAGEPLAYVIGHVPFLDATIRLDSRPLIPRAETEYWVRDAIGYMRSAYAQPRVLDLCAGSGCIGIAALCALPDAHVTFAEIAIEHHDTIRRSLRENGIAPARAALCGGDLFSSLPHDTFDAILSNPPYIDPARSARVEQSVIDYEPPNALFGGRGGMEIIERILADAPAYMAHDGVLYIEHEPEQTGRIHDRAHSRGYASCTTHADQYDIERYSVLSR